MDSDKIIESLTEIRTQMRWMTQDVSEIKKEVKNLNAFKFKVIGAVALAITIIEIIRM
jgi:hypothetical protein